MIESLFLTDDGVADQMVLSNLSLRIKKLRASTSEYPCHRSVTKVLFAWGEMNNTDNINEFFNNTIELIFLF